ncbi:MAG: DoxX family protein [Planctomycetaceae bacterium]
MKSLLPAPLRRMLRSLGLLVLRVGLGGTILYGHGWDKLSSFREKAGDFYDPFGLGGTTSLALATFAEFFCSILVMLGLATRLAAIPLMGTMGTAFFLYHADDPFQIKELALVYLVGWTTLLLTGPGELSLDALFFREKK